MKKNLLNPGFEFTFALGVIMMLLLPPLVMAQQPPQELKVIIQNNDTTINGKNIKSLSAVERKKALKDMADLGKDFSITASGNVNGITMMSRHGGPGDKHMERSFNFKSDSTEGRWHVSTDDMKARMDDFEKSFRRNHDNMENNLRLRQPNPFGNRNSQSFNYSNTNKDGFSTNVDYNVNDVNRETAKRISGVEKADLEINDLILTPSFSTGKTNLSFALAEKGSAEVQFKDNEGKVLWSDKTSGSFSKSFELPQNGIYYLQVKQGNKVGLRRIVKEQ